MDIGKLPLILFMALLFDSLFEVYIAAAGGFSATLWLASWSSS
jgi:hypothetical protein